ncbi:MAG: triose-phosphate isomerase [Candidatus Margulisiibacteriota bacterium]
MKPIIAANWKMNLALEDARELSSGIESVAQINSDIEVIIAPPSCFLTEVGSRLNGAALSAQTISEFESGAYTGEVSAKMIKSCNAKFTLLGHSERRHVFFETNQMIKEKLEQCKRYQITPILCVGETLEERNAGQLKTVIANQLDVVAQYDEIFYIAYEPVWAIGTGETATPEMADKAHQFIKNIIGEGIPILYGGSVNSGNIDGLLTMPNIDGALVGGASLKLDEFTKMIEIAAQIERVSNEKV